MEKGIIIRLYPDQEQQTNMNKLLGCYRYLYNSCLNLKINEYNENKNNFNLSKLSHYYHNILRTNPDIPWLKEANTKVLKQAILNLLDAYNNFFENGSGFPKFKSKHNNKLTCRFPLEAISSKNNYADNKITLIKSLKDIKFKTSKKNKKVLQRHKDNIRSATLTKHKSGKYTLSILVDVKDTYDSYNEKLLFSKPKEEFVGLDVGTIDFIVDSQGKRFENIKSIRNNQKRLSRLHRVHSKRVKGSNNRNKARIKLAKCHEKIKNKKENYLHQTINSILNENQVIAIETLDIKGMMKNHKLAKAIQELSLHKFKTILEYKAKWYGRTVVKVDKFYPSTKLCSDCDYKNDNLSLKDRDWICPKCKSHHDRDINAAINILREGVRLYLIENPDHEFSEEFLAKYGKYIRRYIPCRAGELTPLEIM